MYYKLKPQYRLRGWEKLPYALVDTAHDNRVTFLSKPQFDALSLCSGKINCDLPVIPDSIRHLMPQLEQNGVIEKCGADSLIDPKQEYRKYPSRYIKTAHWSVTGRCNYRCRHCYMSAPEAKYGELTHETVMDLIDQLESCGVMNVSLTGGECLVRRDFLDIVDALLERDIHITQIYSNGALVNEKLLLSLAERGIRPEFNMSYDAPGWHDWLRGIDGAQAAVERAFRLCLEHGFPTGAEMCIHDKNKHLLRDTVNRLVELGCRSLKTNPVGDVGEWKKNGYGQTVSIEELFELYLDYIPHFYEDGMPLAIQLGGLFSASPGKPDRFDIPLAKGRCDPQKTCVCGHARMVMYISADGRALPCMSLSGMDIQEQFPLITETGLADCLTDSFYMEFIDRRASDYLALHPECRSCEYAPYCLGGCRASALEHNGGTDLMGRDEACCKMFREGYAARVLTLMRRIRPEANCLLAEDPFWQRK